MISHRRHIITIIPHHQFGGQGPLLHFAHANGYPPRVYRQFIAPFLEKYTVVGVEHRPLWPDAHPDQLTSWRDVGDDLIRFFDQQKYQNVVGIGHSLGAVATMFAAVKRPDLFRTIVLIEPVFLPPAMLAQVEALPQDQRMELPIVQLALARRDVWETRQALFEYYRPKQVFGRLSDELLWDYVNYATKETADGRITLAYSKQWEAHIYSRFTQVWDDIPRLTQPTLAIRAAQTDTVFPDAWTHWQTAQPEATFIEVPETTHLVPLEQPAALAQTILAFLAEQTA